MVDKTIPALEMNITYKIGRYWVRSTHDDVVDYHRYSRKWHRSYGPSRTVENRRLEISTTSDMKKIVHTVLIAGYRLGWQKRAVTEMHNSGFQISKAYFQ